MNFTRFSSILVLACFLFIGCNNKKTAKGSTITGKWIYKEMIFLPGSPLNDMTDDQKEAAGDDAKGTTFQFNSDGTYSVSAGDKEDPLTGTYEIKEGDNMILTNERHPSGESVKISFPGKNTLKIEQTDKKVALVVERVE